MYGSKGAPQRIHQKARDAIQRIRPMVYHSADCAKCATPTHHLQCFAIDAIYPAMYCTVLGRKLQEANAKEACPHFDRHLIQIRAGQVSTGMIPSQQAQNPPSSVVTENI